tara:strand:+ start:8962 stop:9828 length:867 start_codon:yes stop_codon:yes gene_type:complete
MGNQRYGESILVVYAQVGKAKANHRVENDTHFLRAKSFRLPSKVVYLGDVATNTLAYLEHPETPFFSKPPQFNEQKWAFQTQSGGLHVSISSDSYWGLGLFNSGYLNRIELKGTPLEYSRLLFDLSASLGHKPWEFTHLSSAERYLAKHDEKVSIQSNEQTWKDALETARSMFGEQMFMVQEKATAVQKRIEKAAESDNWNKVHAQISLENGLFDLDIAKGALADGNAPSFERALARAEAYFIEADPDNENENGRDGFYDSPQGKILDQKEDTGEVMLVDLTSNSEEE